MLGALGVMAEPHSIALTLLVDALAEWIRFAKAARKARPLVAGSTGNEVPNPIFALKNQAWDRVLRACREFGMTPSAISAVKSIKADEKKPTAVRKLKLS
jgi:phage terminase small subunit